jgi:non-ribosomal peptide synthetase-like protein
VGDNCLIYTLGLALLLAGVLEFYDGRNEVVIGLLGAVTLLFTIAYWVLVERIVMHFRNLQPRFCSIYDPAFWCHERVWKVPAVAYIQVINGTPFKNLLWRLLGVRIGRRVFDDGAALTERTLVTIGDGCTLNASSKIRCHSQGGPHLQVRPRHDSYRVHARGRHFVRYGTTIGDGAVLATDSFLMKGEEVPQNAVWRGNPAPQIRDVRSGSASGLTSRMRLRDVLWAPESGVRR